MAVNSWTIQKLRRALLSGKATPASLAELALSRSNRNPGRNTYLWQDAAWTRTEAARVESTRGADGGEGAEARSALWGMPISVKDCFDLAGAPTSCGVKFYRDLNGTADEDSWLVEQLRAGGAVITGKTHLHPLAYGITGENPEFGDCLQPAFYSDLPLPPGLQHGTPATLTGGSSSGAAASVLEGSAVAAIGTDTGGSIRAPAALCGLAGYRSTHGRGDWRGGAHLAESFDTMGWLFRDLEDAPLLAQPFAPALHAEMVRYSSFGFVEESFLHDCDAEIVAGFRAAIQELESLGLNAKPVDVTWWADALEIFGPIQAWEAARIHAGNFEHFQPAIRERMEWGARITTAEIIALRVRHAEFRARMDEVLAANELLLLPSIPVTRLVAGEGQSQTDIRMRLLRYTTPFSLGGVPVVAIPCSAGGMQLAGARDHDESLLRLAARLGAQRNKTSA
jgi:aspartyl-tRNA(Asn)/glutamyl-tRNA(Gln) amidotransferase subunit A